MPDRIVNKVFYFKNLLKHPKASYKPIGTLLDMTLYSLIVWTYVHKIFY